MAVFTIGRLIWPQGQRMFSFFPMEFFFGDPTTLMETVCLLRKVNHHNTYKDFLVRNGKRTSLQWFISPEKVNRLTYYDRFTEDIAHIVTLISVDVATTLWVTIGPYNNDYYFVAKKIVRWCSLNATISTDSLHFRFTRSLLTLTKSVLHSP